MPAALEVPWTRIAAEAGAGAPLDELAKTYNISLGTLKARSAREGWKRTGRELAAKAQGDTVEPAKPQAGGMQPRATGVPLLARLGERSRLNLSRTVDKAARTFAKLPGEAVIDRASQLQAIATTGDKLNGWSKAEAGVNLVNITIGPGPDMARPCTVVDTDLP